MAILEKIFKKSEATDEQEQAPVAEDEVKEAKEVVEDEVKEPEQVNSNDSELAELKAQLQAQANELAELKAARENAEKALASERADRALAVAVQDGKLLPSQISEGSPWVEIAHNAPSLFERLTATLGQKELPVVAKLSDDANKSDDANSMLVKYRELIKSGKSPEDAFTEVSK